MVQFNEQPLSRFLDTVGDGTGSIDAAQDFSSTPGVFTVKPGPTQLFQISRFRIIIRDSAIVNERYGNKAGGLTNGYTIDAFADVGADVQLFGGRIIKTNLDFVVSGFDDTVSDNGSGDAILRNDINIVDSANIMLSLNGRLGQGLRVTLSDDFSSLAEHQFRVTGFVDI